MYKTIKVITGTHNQRLSKLVTRGVIKYGEIVDNEKYTDEYLDTQIEWVEGNEEDFEELGTFDKLFNLGKIKEDDEF